jgi:hypothetical protein
VLFTSDDMSLWDTSQRVLFSHALERFSKR